jgi:ATP-dependent DNA ligase
MRAYAYTVVMLRRFLLARGADLVSDTEADLQDQSGRELLDQPLQVRRRRLEGLLASAPPQLPVCPQTTDRAVAEAWFTDLGVAGIEGVLVKRADSCYRPGKAGWVKVRAKDTADYIVGGVTGSLVGPGSLLLGPYDRHDTLRFVNQMHPLKADQRREVTALLRGMVFQGDAGHPWPCPLPAAWSVDLADRQPTAYVPVDPTLVAEVEVDMAVDGPFGKARHRCWFVRLRPDLHPRDVDVVMAALHPPR